MRAVILRCSIWPMRLPSISLRGNQYQSVIINLQCAHAVMLVRPLIYTAITRAKLRVILVGERRALCMAIKRTDTEKRGTMLAERICQLEKVRI